VTRPGDDTDAAARDGADASHAARSGAVQVLTLLAQALIAATQVVFARLYGQMVYGAYLSTLAVLEVLGRGGAAGADRAMLRYVAAFRASGNAAGVRSAIGTGLRLGLAVSATFAVVMVLAAPRVAALLGEPAMTPALRALAALPLLTAPLWILMQASLAARVTRANFYVRGVAEPALLLLAGVVAWALGARLPGLATAHLASYVVTLCLAVVVARRAFRPEEIRRPLAAPHLRGFARFSLPMAAAEMLNAVVQRADITILTALQGTRAAAVYGAAELLTRPIVSIRYAFDSIVAGVLSETLHLGDVDRLRYNLRLTVRWVVSVASPIAATMVVLRRELLGLMFGSSYVAGASALVALSVAQFVNASLGLVGWVLMVAGRSRLGLLNNVLAAAFNLTAAGLLIPRFGITGAAYAALGTVLLLQAAMVVEVAVLQRVHPFAPALLKPLLAAAPVFVVESFLRPAIAPVWARIPAVIAAGAVVYALGLLALRLPPEERRILARALETLRRKR
jgi:O-antigen/teichoic acid export membrane protein